jgi:hypothetical protein
MGGKVYEPESREENLSITKNCILNNSFNFGQNFILRLDGLKMEITANPPRDNRPEALSIFDLGFGLGPGVIFFLKRSARCNL